MALGQAAGTAADLAIKTASALRKLDTKKLQQQLIRDNAVLTYFSDLPKTDPDFAAAQRAALLGFFPTYETDLDAALSETDASNVSATFGTLASTIFWHRIPFFQRRRHA